MFLVHILLKDSCGCCSIDHPAPQYFLYPSKKLPMPSWWVHTWWVHTWKSQESKGKDTFFVSSRKLKA